MANFNDPVILFRNWLREHPLFKDEVGIFLGEPTTLEYPYISVSMIGDGGSVYVPSEFPRITFDVWGTDQYDVYTIKADLKKAFFEVSNIDITPQTRVHWIRWDNAVMQTFTPNPKEPRKKLYRVIVDVTVMLRANGVV